MAAELVENPSIIQTVEHDLESVYWVLLSMVIRYMENTWSHAECASTLFEVMSPKVYRSSGGLTKRHHILNPFSLNTLYTPQSYHVGRLLRCLHKILCQRYAQKALAMQPPSRTDESLDEDHVTTDESPDEGLDEDESPEAPDKGTDEGANESTGKMTWNEVTEVKAVNPEPKNLHATLIWLFSSVLKCSSWGANDRAPQDIQMPNDEVSDALSSSKRSRDMVEKSGASVTLPEAKIAKLEV